MLRFLTAGESHGPAITAILDGIPAGLHLDKDMIDHDLYRRQKGYGSGARMKIEQDRVQILSGMMAGQTTGAPITLLIENLDHKKWKGKAVDAMTAPRPGHADLTGAIKHGFKDLRPALERASARETAMRVAVGSVCKQFLAQFGINIGGYVRSIGEIEAEIKSSNYPELFSMAEKSEVRCPDPNASEKMRNLIEHTMKNKDTLGGIIEIAAIGLPIGLGSFSQWDRRLEGKLAQAILSVQAIKGMEIGDAFSNTRFPGTKVHDAIKLDQTEIKRNGNKAGGIEGGISNGEPVIVKAAMKPIATTLTPQRTVDLASGEEVPTRYERSDFCPVPRAVPILEAMVAFVLADALIEKLGGDSMEEMLPRYKTLRKANLDDLQMDNESITWWPDQTE